MPGPGASWSSELQDGRPGPDELLAVYRSELERGLPSSWSSAGSGRGAGRQLEVVPTPAFLTALVPFAAYEPPPIYPGAAHRPVLRHRARIRRCRRRLWPSSAGAIAGTRIPAMVAHEAYPGHHLQLLTLQGLDSEVRRHVWTPIMVEGWALYCEQLMEEAGYLSHRRGAALPAGQSAVARHPGGARRRAAHPRHDPGGGGGLPGGAPADRAASAEAEVRRYCAWPTYQLCYAVGRRELLRLRDAYRDADEATALARRFHDELMSYGGLPVSLARWGMDLASARNRKDDA